MAFESLSGAIKEIARGGSGITRGRVSKKSPLQIKPDGETSVVIEKDALIVPRHVGSLEKGNVVYMMEAGENTFFVLGKG